MLVQILPLLLFLLNRLLAVDSDYPIIDARQAATQAIHEWFSSLGAKLRLTVLLLEVFEDKLQVGLEQVELIDIISISFQDPIKVLEDCSYTLLGHCLTNLQALRNNAFELSVDFLLYLLDSIRKLLLNLKIHGKLVAGRQAEHRAITNLKQALSNFLLREDVVLAEHLLHLSELSLVTLFDLSLDVVKTLLLHCKKIADL